MPYRLQREVEKLKKMILRLAAIVEERVWMAVRSLKERNKEQARKVIEGDPEIDQMEVDIEEECLKVLALHQPVAIDLRFIISVLKVNNELERIGDLAVNIAERATFLAGHPEVKVPADFRVMVEKTQAMLKNSLDALVNMDAKLAHDVCEADDEVDGLNRKMFEQIQDAIVKKPAQIQPLVHLLSASRHLERVADHATNIAEDVIYLVKGEIVRHKTEDFTA